MMRPTTFTTRSILLLVLLVARGVQGFLVTPQADGCRRRVDTMVLHMGKSLHKQAELRRKMQAAKQQKEAAAAAAASASANKPTSDAPSLTAAQIKERNDRHRFEQLLKSSSSTVLNDYSSDGYLNQEQEEAEITARLGGVDRLFEGDPTPPDTCFAELVHVQTNRDVGTTAGLDRLLPWRKRKTTTTLRALSKKTNKSDFIVCLVDPREKSPDLRQAFKTLQAQLSPALLERLIVINADSPAENRRWLKRTGKLPNPLLQQQQQQPSIKTTENTATRVTSVTSISSGSSSGRATGTVPTSPINRATTTTTLSNNNNNNLGSGPTILADEKLEWMRTFTALGETRWTMTVYVLANQRVEKLAREVDVYNVQRVVEKAVQSYLNE